MAYNNYDIGSGATNNAWSQALASRLAAINASAAQKTAGNVAKNAWSSLPRGSNYSPVYSAGAGAVGQKAPSLSDAINYDNSSYNQNYGGSSGSGGGVISPASSGGATSISSASSGGSNPANPSGTSAGGATTNPNPATYSGGGTPTITGNNSWYGDVLTAAQPNLQKDQDMQAYVYGKKAGLSDYWIQNLQNYVDPYAQLLAQNASSGGAGPSTQGVLDYSGGVYDYGMKKSADTQGNGFNAAQIVQSTLSAMSPATASTANTASGKTDAKASTLGAALYGNPDPSTQVSAVKEYLGTALRNVVPDEILGAYLQTINQYGMQFVAMKNTAGNEKDNDNFGQWLQKQLGATGGF